MTDDALDILQRTMNTLCDAYTPWNGKITRARIVLVNVSSNIKTLQRIQSHQCTLPSSDKHPIDALMVAQELHSYMNYAKIIQECVCAIPLPSVTAPDPKSALESLVRQSKSADAFMEAPLEKEELRGKIMRLWSIYYEMALRTGEPMAAMQWADAMVLLVAPHVTILDMRGSHLSGCPIGDGARYVASPRMSLIDRIVRWWRGSKPRPGRSQTRNPWET